MAADTQEDDPLDIRKEVMDLLSSRGCNMTVEHGIVNVRTPEGETWDFTEPMPRELNSVERSGPPVDPDPCGMAAALLQALVESGPADQDAARIASVMYDAMCGDEIHADPALWPAALNLTRLFGDAGPAARGEYYDQLVVMRKDIKSTLLGVGIDGINAEVRTLGRKVLALKVAINVLYGMTEGLNRKPIGGPNWSAPGPEVVKEMGSLMRQAFLLVEKRAPEWRMAAELFAAAANVVMLNKGPQGELKDLEAVMWRAIHLVFSGAGGSEMIRAHYDSKIFAMAATARTLSERQMHREARTLYGRARVYSSFLDLVCGHALGESPR
jgi:hypothetical protein